MSRFSRRIYKQWPHWENFEAIEEESRVIRVPSENKQVSDPLTIHEDSKYSLIVAWFSGCHAHFDNYEEEGDDHIDQAIQFIEEILNENLSFVGFWSSGKQYGGMVVRQEDLLAHLPRKVSTVCVRSWRGTYDQDIQR